MIIRCEQEPVFNERGDVESECLVLLNGQGCKDIPDFPGRESIKKVKRLSLLPLEIEYEPEPPELKMWACTDADGDRSVKYDLDGCPVIYSGGDYGCWRGGEYIVFESSFLKSFPEWPPPGQRREISSIVFNWADEEKT